MSTKLVAVYDKPDDEAAFLAHYEQVHTPIVLGLPGLQELRITKVRGHFMGDVEPYMIAEMLFEDKASFDAAMASEANKNAGADLANFARGKVSVFFAQE